MLGLAFAVFSAAVIMFRLREVQHQGRFGATTVIATMMAFTLGALAVLGDTVVASAGGVATALALALKGALHGWVKRLSWEELRAGLLLLAMTVILLPVLPNREFGPFSAFNPHELWFMTVLIAAVSFVGYVAIKLTGDRRGVPLSGLAGGLVSSTAVTMSMARLARENPDNQRLFAAGALLANVAMMIRVIIMVFLFNAELLRWLALPLTLAAVTQASAAGLLMRRQGHDSGADRPVLLKNPFELQVVLSFGALLALIMFLGKVLTVSAGTRGAFALAAAAGIADVDAITLSMVRLARADVSGQTAALAILIAISVNTIAKAVIAGVTGGRGLGRLMAFAATAALASGTIGLQLAVSLGTSGWLK